MELTSSLAAGGTSLIDLVETVGPVDTHQSDHRQVNADTEAGRAFHVEGIEVACIAPCVTSLKESESVDGGVAQHERIAQLEGEAVVGIGIVAAVAARRTLTAEGIGRQRYRSVNYWEKNPDPGSGSFYECK